MIPADAFLVVVLFGVIGLLALWRLPSSYCPQCVHCRQEAWIRKSEAGQRKAAEDARKHQDFHRVYGSDGCPWCEE